MIKIIHQTDSNIKFTYKNVEYTREYQRGDDALYIQLNDTKGNIAADELFFDIKKQTLDIASFDDNKINANINLK